MPELADVEGFKRFVRRHAEGQRVHRVHAPDARVLRNTSPQGLGRALKGKRLGGPCRHGKWLDIPAGDGHLVLHFGMTGGLSWTCSASQPQKHDGVVLELDDGALHYVTQRKLGGVWWVPAKGAVEDVTGRLGPDAAAIDRATFQQRLTSRGGALKPALMDQRLLSGLGNELSDEILWRARVLPHTNGRDLSERQLDALYDAMRDVLRESMKRGRVPDQGPWLNAVRGQKAPTCPRCQTRVRTGQLGGRTAYWCPRCQR